MVIIESYAYDLPGQSGFVARDVNNRPVAAARDFTRLLTQIWGLGHGRYCLKGERTIRATLKGQTPATQTAG